MKEDVLEEIDEFVLDEIDEFTSEPVERRSFRKKHPTALLVLTTILVTSGLVAATVLLFTQILPGPTSTGALLTEGCASTTPFPASVVQPAPAAGSVTWDCLVNAAHVAAFTSNMAGTAQASFTLTGFNALWIIPHQAPAPVVGGCVTVTGRTQISPSGTTITFVGPGSATWDYCADYNIGASSLAVGPVSWTQVTP